MSHEDAVALFQRFDVNGNGTLGFDELREPLCKESHRVLESFSQAVADHWRRSR